MSDDEITVIVGAPVESPDEQPGIPNSIQVAADCGHEMWLAPSGQKFVEEHPDVGKVCALCAVASITSGEMTSEAAPLRNDQFVELAAALLNNRKN